MTLESVFVCRACEALKPGINNGVWLLKNTAWSHDFLYRWWHSDILQGPGKESCRRGMCSECVHRVSHVGFVL